MRSSSAAATSPAPIDAGDARGLARVLFVLALALACLRYFRLGQWSLWFDEAVTWTDIHIGLGGGEIKNPLGYWAIAGWVRAVGGPPDEFTLRFLPATFGVGCVALTYFAFRPFAGPLRASAASLLLAASTWHVYWSQNARFYTMTQFISLVGAAIVLRALWSDRVVLALVGFAIAGVAALFHPSAALVLPALVTLPWILWALPGGDAKPAKRPAIALAVVAAIGALSQVGWLWQTWETFHRQKAASYPVHYLLTTGFYVTPLWATAALLGAWRAREESFARAACWIVAGVLCAALIVSFAARITAQYVFVALPWIALLAACMLPRSIAEARRSFGLAALCILLLPTLATTGLYFTVRNGERPRWREAYEFVWNERDPGDLIAGMEATVGEFYLSPRSTQLRQPDRIMWLDYWRVRMVRTWIRHARPTWFILNPEQLYDWDVADREWFEAMLREECQLVKDFPLYVESRDLSVKVYRRGGGGGGG
ncbi:MAG: ArnT family glycosyltransferase, partial [Planctomycetota bacterium]